MWILISLLAICVHTISICPPPSISKLNLTTVWLSDPKDDIDLALTSPRAHSTDPHRITQAPTLNSRPTSANPIKQKAKKLCLCPCGSTDSSDDEKELPVIPAQEQSISPRVTTMDHTPPTRRSDIPRPQRNITPPPMSTQALIPKILPLDDFTPAQKPDTPQPDAPTRIDIRRPGNRTSPALASQLPDTTIEPLALPPSRVSIAELMQENIAGSQRVDMRRPNTKMIIQDAFIWIMQQLQRRGSTSFTTCPYSPLLSYTLVETILATQSPEHTIPTLMQTILCIKPQLTDTTSKAVRVQTISSPKISLISLCISFINHITPQDVTETPLEPLLSYLQQHLSPNTLLKIPAEHPMVFDCSTDNSAIHCVMKYVVTPKQ